MEEIERAKSWIGRLEGWGYGRVTVLWIYDGILSCIYWLDRSSGA